MRIRFFKALWGMDGSIEEQLDQIVGAGYEGIEAPAQEKSASSLGLATRERGLGFVLQAFPLTADELRSAVDDAASCGAERLNVHSGKDWWDFSTGADFFERSLRVQEQSPVPIVHETHRGRLLFSPTATAAYLTAFPDLRITADFSHFTCVCESLLHDQEKSLAILIEQTRYIHARVGHEEGPQVGDPSAAEWQRHVARFEGWWDQMVGAARTRGDESIEVVPEFGPPQYMPTIPHTGKPVADLWAVCLYMKNRLAERWLTG